MDIKIALAGNPNSGKTTMFNALTGSNQFVGNWPGVTVEKKEGKLKKHSGVVITDLPGIYSLSSYTMEEVVARNYLLDEHPDVILNIVDGTNIERNLYLTTQLIELGIPVVIAINMMDIVRKNGDAINIEELSKRLGCKIVEVSALKNDNVAEMVELAVEEAKHGRANVKKTFSDAIERIIENIEKTALTDVSDSRRRWYGVKIFERDSKVLESAKLPDDVLSKIDEEIKSAEAQMNDDAEAIIINERYSYIERVLKGVYSKKNTEGLTTSDKIDKIVTNRWLGLPIFAVIMFLIYYIAMVAVGTPATDWANDGVFGDGWYLFGIGRGAYEEAVLQYDAASNAIDAYIGLDTSREDFDSEAFTEKMKEFTSSEPFVKYTVVDEETLGESEILVYFDNVPENVNGDVNSLSYRDAAAYFEQNGFDEPIPSKFGTWIPGIPMLIERGLDLLKCADWLKALILDGIVAGVGAVLGFVPQILVLFLLLAFLEACGYMTRIAFVLDRIFRKFGLSGKSFIPILVGTGCGVPGIMASRTIENQNDRRMTVITTTFIPCSAKTPFIAMMAGAIFGGSALVAVSSYLIGILAIIISGVILKKTKLFAGDLSPFIMELPAYHMPMPSNILRSMWERGWSFIKKAGTVVLLSTVIVWFLSFFGFVNGEFRMLGEDEIGSSILGFLGSGIKWIFKPLGWGTWQATVASITGLVAKENIVGTMGVLYGSGDRSVYAELANVFTGASGYSFLVFNLLCAPCFAAMSAIKREMNSGKWTFYAIGYQCLFAYLTAFVINQIGSLFTAPVGTGNIIGAVISFVIIVIAVYLIFRPNKNNNSFKMKSRKI